MSNKHKLTLVPTNPNKTSGCALAPLQALMECLILHLANLNGPITPLSLSSFPFNECIHLFKSGNKASLNEMEV
jgi:hypothetical protein